MHVCFDMNGTVLDVAALVPDAPRGTGLRVLEDTVAQAMVDTMTGTFRPFPEYLRAALVHLAVVAGLGDAAVEAGVQAAKALPPFDDAGAALDAVAAAGHVPVVLTNSATDAAERALRAAGLRDKVAGVIGADAVGAYKPDARIYRHALATFGAAAGETWLVAAHWWDVAGAKRAGLCTAWVGRDERVLLETVPEPDVRAPSLASAVAAIV